MRRWLPFVIPFILILALGATAWWMTHRDQDFGRDGPVLEVDFAALELSSGPVRLSGMAHYRGTIVQKVPATVLSEEQTWYVFPLFPVYDTDNREVRVLVRTQRPPEKIISYEIMTLEGRPREVTPERVPFSTEILMGQQADYFFADEVILIEPWRITVDEEVWEAP